MKYWDSSALLPLIVREATSSAMQSLLGDDTDVLTWWGSRVEAHSALARLERDGALPATSYEAAMNRLRQFAASWHEVAPTEVVREQAERLLRVHALRAADAFQLAAAVVASEHRPASLLVITLDARLQQAAVREGFSVLPSG